MKSPEYTNSASDFHFAEHVDFLYDLTYQKDGKRIHEQEIFEAQLDLISNAEEFLLLDIFLFNDDYTKGEIEYRSQVAEMTDALIAKKKKNRQMPIILITDPLNNFYGAYEEDNITRLKEAGIEVKVTDLSQLKDSNPLFSGIYRAYFQWFERSSPTYIPNLFEKNGPKVNIHSLLKLANFKSNHRKTYLSERLAIVSSSNPHDPSSLHSNVALRFSGPAMEDLLASELSLLDNPPIEMLNWKSPPVTNSEFNLRIITERAIQEALLNNLKMTQEGDKVWIGIFYIADFEALKALGRASIRGVEVNIIADLNKDAFGLEKNGSPNRPALTELSENYPDINIRWYQTTGEQFHTKIMYFDYLSEDPRAILGSANFTRRNLQGYNLETDVEIIIPRKSTLKSEMDQYFNRIWNNTNGKYTVDFEDHLETSFLLRNLWKFQEYFGLSTW